MPGPKVATWGVMSTSCSTSPRADRAPGWNPPALGFNVLVVVVVVVGPVVFDDDDDEAALFDPAWAEDEVDRRRGSDVDVAAVVVTGDERDEGELLLLSEADGIVLINSCSEVRAASGLPVPVDGEDEGDPAPPLYK